MKILLTNDDGINAKGIQALIKKWSRVIKMFTLNMKISCLVCIKIIVNACKKL